MCLLGGAQVYLEFHRHQQFFIHRGKTSGDRLAGYVQKFLLSGRTQKTVTIQVKDEESAEEVKLTLRLILGPDDSEGKPIVFVTNLIDRKKYKARHGKAADLAGESPANKGGAIHVVANIA